MFWKHEEAPFPKPMETPTELGLGTEHDLGLGLGEPGTPPGTPEAPSMPGTQSGMPSPMLGIPPSPGIPEAPPIPGAPPTQPSTAEKDIQLLSAKLDSLKAILENINQRLVNIERIAQESQESEKHEVY